MILIADSGSTKTDWRIIENKTVVGQYSTIGLNPFFVDSKTVALCLQNFDHKEEVKSVFFYGAGCVNDEKRDIIRYGIASVFINAEVFIDDDLTGAACAMFKNEKGVIAILGTGMSIAFYNGKVLTDRGVSLGYILGDEGSGTCLGKELLRTYLYGEMPKEIEKAFDIKYKTNKDEILNSVYKQLFPNKYIADYSKFLNEHINNKFIEKIVLRCFNKFFEQHVLKIKDSKLYPVRLIGSIAFNFEKQLKKVAKEHMINIDLIIQSPIEELQEFHM